MKDLVKALRKFLDGKDDKKVDDKEQPGTHTGAGTGDQNTVGNAGATQDVDTQDDRVGGTEETGKKTAMKDERAAATGTTGGDGTASTSGTSTSGSTAPVTTSEPSTTSTNVEPGTKPTKAPYSLDGPNLPPTEVKDRISDSVNRNWAQIRQSLNLADSEQGKNEARAFFMGAASRESGTGETMRTNLITGEGSSYSKGPLQTADTAYANNGHPDWEKDSHVPGIAQADLSMSNDLDTAIDMGVRHMLEGAERGKLAGHSAPKQLKMDAMAFHNTGHIEAASDEGWRSSYGEPVLRMADWYNNGHLDDSNVVYTGQV